MAQFHEVTIETIGRKWRFIAFIITIVASLTFLISALIPPVYESRSQFLILQKNINIDAYRAAKASEYAGDVIKRVISSSDFMDGTLVNMQDVKAHLGRNQREQLENWNKTVKVTSVVNTGIIDVQVLSANKKEGRFIMEALVNGLMNEGEKYHGNENIVMKKIGGPVYYDDPAYPLVWVNTGIAGLFGFFLAIGLIFIFGKNVDGWMYVKSRPSIQVTAERDPFRDQAQAPSHTSIAQKQSEPLPGVIRDDRPTVAADPQSAFTPQDYTERLRSILGEK